MPARLCYSRPYRYGQTGGDPQEQFASPFSYAGNNPVMYNDPDGEILPLIAVVAIIGGAINLGTNIAQGNLSGYGFWETIGRGAVSFGAGAASGALSLSGPMGWAAGGAIVGGANAGLGGGDIINGLAMGAATGLAGGALGRVLGPGIGRLADGLVKSPALAGALGGGAGGGIIGFALGGLGSLATGGSFWDGAWSGLGMGLLTGTIAGGSSAAIQAKQLGFNPWTGNRANSIAVQQLTPKGANTSTSPPVQKPISGTNRIGVRDPSIVGGDMKIRVGDFASKQLTFGKGSFSVFNWKGYPAGGIKPTGSFRLLQGAEYAAARKLANATNAAMRRANPSAFKGLQIHEIHPVKFGGSPTSLSNKIFLTQPQHTQYTNFWNSLMRNIK